jgi:hypothetical protein
MSTNQSRVACWLAAAAALGVAPLIGAQQQAPNPRAGWPCGARIDPSYFRVAEGSGGHLLLLAPEEIGDSGALLAALAAHPQTVFRLAGTINAGVHEFHVPVDSSVESVLFSVSVQCLQTADVMRPSGGPVSGDDVTDLSNFRAGRLVIVKRPEPGMWTVRAAGSGVAGVVVQARSTLGIARVQFAAGENAAFMRVPSADVENVVKIDMNGHPTRVDAWIVNGAFRRLAPLPLTAGETDSTYMSRFTPGVEGFRILVEGTNADGVRFQRVHAPLFTPVR